MGKGDGDDLGSFGASAHTAFVCEECRAAAAADGRTVPLFTPRSARMSTSACAFLEARMKQEVGGGSGGQEAIEAAKLAGRLGNMALRRDIFEKLPVDGSRVKVTFIFGFGIFPGAPEELRARFVEVLELELCQNDVVSQAGYPKSARYARRDGPGGLVAAWRDAEPAFMKTPAYTMLLPLFEAHGAFGVKGQKEYVPPGAPRAFKIQQALQRFLGAGSPAATEKSIGGNSAVFAALPGVAALTGGRKFVGKKEFVEPEGRLLELLREHSLDLHAKVVASAPQPPIRMAVEAAEPPPHEEAPLKDKFEWALRFRNVKARELERQLQLAVDRLARWKLGRPIPASSKAPSVALLANRSSQMAWDEVNAVAAPWLAKAIAAYHAQARAAAAPFPTHSPLSPSPTHNCISNALAHS